MRKLKTGGFRNIAFTNEVAEPGFESGLFTVTPLGTVKAPHELGLLSLVFCAELL